MTPSISHALVLVAGLLAGCAPKVPLELANARTAYHQASIGPAKQLVPAELHKASEALDLAEAAFENDPKGYNTLDLAYVAQRKAELAVALADQASHAGNTAAANSQYQSTQDTIMRQTREDLGATQSDLAASQTTVATTVAQLTASETARLLAEQRTREAMAALAELAAVKEESRGMVITLSGSLLFRTDEAVLLPEAQTRLGQVTDALLTTKERTILVEGHTDSQGSDEHNLDLAQRRADAVRNFMSQRGYDASRIRAVGIGEARPIADNTTDEGRANNRRVEVIVEPAATASQ